MGINEANSRQKPESLTFIYTIFPAESKFFNNFFQTFLSENPSGDQIQQLIINKRIGISLMIKYSNYSNKY